MNKGYKRAKTILVMGISSLIMLIAAIGLVVWGVADTAVTIGATNEITGEGISFNFTYFIVGIILIVVSVIVSFIGSILILTAKFNHEYLDNQKMIFGILSLVLIGSIGLIIFGSMAVKKLSSNPNSSVTSSNAGYDNPVETVI